MPGSDSGGMGAGGASCQVDETTRGGAALAAARTSSGVPRTTTVTGASPKPQRHFRAAGPRDERARMRRARSVVPV